MTAALALAALLALAPAHPDDGETDVAYTPLTLRLGGDLLDNRVVDMDGDGRQDLVVAVLARRPGLPPRREIRIHAAAPDGTPSLQPTRVVGVPDDAILYAFADVRDEPGRELLLMTRTGVHSLSPRVEGLRDNLRRLATRDLLYQVPSSRSLASWSYVIERAGQHDLLLVPGAQGLSIWGPGTGGAATAAGATAPGGPGARPTPADDYASLAELGGVPDGGYSVKSPGAVQASAGAVSISIDAGRNWGLFLEDVAPAYAFLLQAEVRAEAPALADLDGDGRKDLVFFDERTLRVQLGQEAGFSATPDRSEPLPEWLDPGDGDLQLYLRDLDGDGDADAYARVSPEQERLSHVTFSYFVMFNDGRGLTSGQDPPATSA